MEEVGAEHGREAPPLEVVELRIHGVHGTSPASMLGITNDQVIQVAGDSITGIFRAAPDVELPLRNLAGRQISVEAYSWGALTSGVRGALGWVKRALWLILLPFALVNLSYWARLNLAEDRAVARWGARATRLGALLLTVFFVLTPCLLGIDLVAWQCYRWGSPTCSLPGFFDFMGGFAPTQRLALGSLVPLLAIGILAYLSKSTLQRYEAIGGPHHEPKGEVKNDDPDRVLRHPRLWQPTRRTRQLQRVHLTVALAVVIDFAGGHVIATDQGNPWLIWVLVLASACVAAAAVGWSMVIHPDDVDPTASDRHRIVALRRQLPEWLQTFSRNNVPDVLLGLMVALAAVNMITLFRMGDTLDESRDFSGHNMWFIVVFVALTAVHLSVFTSGRMPTVWSLVSVATVLVLASLALVLHAAPKFAGRTAVVWTTVGLLGVFWVSLTAWHYLVARRNYTKEAWNGAGASLLLASGAWVALVFTTGIVMASANYLNSSGHGVGDLVSASSGKTAEKSQAKVPASEYSATGTVVADHAVIEQTSTGLALVAGSIRVDTLSLKQNSEPAAELGNVEVTTADLEKLANKEVHLSLPSSSLRLKDTCVRTPSGHYECSAENKDFVASGTLDLAGSTLTIGEGATVTISVATPPHEPLVVPQVLIWSPVVLLVWLLVVLLVLGAAFLFFLLSWPDLEKKLRKDERRGVAEAIPERDHDFALASRHSAAFGHRAERLIDLIGAITALAGLALIALSSTGHPPWDMVAGTRRWATLAMWVAVGLGLGLIYLASLMRTSDNARKGFGILWDLTTFWPRAAHPLAPPCYAERVVPELHTRVEWVLYESDKDGNKRFRPNSRVVLSAHSQGSTIATALLSRLSDDELSRVRVVTYGSQIRGIYGRVFPQVFGPEQIGYVETLRMTWLRKAFPDAGRNTPAPKPYPPPAPPKGRPLMTRVGAAEGNWQNLFRRTDPLGYRVFSDTDQKPDNWVPEVPPVSVGDPGPAVQGHGGYQHSLVYRKIVAKWTEEDVVRDAKGTVDVPGLPQG